MTPIEMLECEITRLSRERLRINEETEQINLEIKLRERLHGEETMLGVAKRALYKAKKTLNRPIIKELSNE